MPMPEPLKTKRKDKMEEEAGRESIGRRQLCPYKGDWEDREKKFVYR